jgi:NADPH:quinone reductase
MTKTMKAAILETYGAPFRISDIPVPAPGPGERWLRIRRTPTPCNIN